MELNDIETLRAELSRREYAALIIEPIQGVNGIKVATVEYLQAAREACKEYGK